MADRQPLGIELVKRGVVRQEDIIRALDFQRDHPNDRLGDILYELKVTDPNVLLKAIGEILNEKTILLTPEDIKIKIDDYIPLDNAKMAHAIPFEVVDGTIKVCFANTSDEAQIRSIRLSLLNKGLVMERYITFRKNVDDIFRTLERKLGSIDTEANVTTIVDDIIRKGMQMRASDIHIEPMVDKVRVRYRIDGILLEVAQIEKEKQTQIIGRLKSLSNMHQEKQEPQDGRIIAYPEYNIRVSSQKNIYGEKFVLRLLKKNQTIKSLFDLGYPKDPALLKTAFEKRNSITVIAAPTGEGKTTTLYSAMTYLNKPQINVTTIEDPVEIRIPGLNQIEIDPKTTFASSLRTVLRQDPDIILVGEIRDHETAEIAVQAGQTGHYVLSTIHTTDAVEVISRLREMGISDYDISSTVATSISQRLVRKLCPHCRKPRKFSDEEKEIIKKIGEKYNVEFNIEDEMTYDPVGCDQCNQSGYFDRIGIFETLLFTDKIKEMVVNGDSTINIRKEALSENYKPLVIEGIRKVIDGITTLQEINSKLLFY